MRAPCHMNLLDVEILLLAREGRPIAKDRPLMDEHYRRARGKKIYQGTNKSEVLEVRAQNVFQREEDKDVSALGDSARTDAHLTMRKADFDAIKERLRPAKGDLVIKIAEESFEPGFEISQVKMGGYLRGKANLVLIYYDRSLENKGSP